LQSIKASPASRSAPQRAGWGSAAAWEGTQPGQLTQADPGDIPHHVNIVLSGKKQRSVFAPWLLLGD